MVGRFENRPRYLIDPLTMRLLTYSLLFSGLTEDAADAPLNISFLNISIIYQIDRTLQYQIQQIVLKHQKARQFFT